MTRRTNAQILIDLLKGLPANQASPRRLADLTGWSIEKVVGIVYASSDELALQVGRGGTIQYRGTERGSTNGLTTEIERVITKYWGPRQLRLRNITVMNTSGAGKRGGGSWVHPDLVVAADPAKRDYVGEPRRLHAIEIETKAGFDIRSVYQAHSQGWGANYRWVIGCKAPGVESADWNRIVRTAEKLRIGLVTFERAGSYGTWVQYLDAPHEKPTPEERERFIEVALGARLRALSNL